MDKHYYTGGGHFERVLRFLNLMEPTPGKMVLSLSKMAMYGMAGIFAYVMVYRSDDLITLIGAVAGGGIVTGNYMYRRHQQQRPDHTGTLPPYGDEPNE
jgi:hypothetical protein